MKIWLKSLKQLGLAALLGWNAGLPVRAQNSYVNFEGKQTNPLRLSQDGTRLFAVNTPDARVSVFDVSNASAPRLIAEIPVGVEPVSVNPTSNDEAWVVNEVSDSVSVVSVSRGIVTDTIQAKDEPVDVVFAAGRAFVSCSRNNLIRVLDVKTHEELAAIPLLGHNPRALAISPNGSKVYAAFALSGNRTTLIPKTQAPGQPMPANITNKPPQVGLLVDATDPAWSNIIKFTMPDNDVVEIDAHSLTVSRYFSRVGTVNLGLAVSPLNGDLFVANTDARNLVRFEPNVRGHVVDSRITRIDISNGEANPVDLNAGFDYTTFPNLLALNTALAQPTATIFHPSGRFLYVAAYGSDRIGRVDTNGTVVARIDVGSFNGTSVNPRTKRGPRGLALNAAAERLYVLNRIANTLAVIDTSNDTMMSEISVGTFDPTPVFIREGRGFLYDAKLSGNGTMSCSSCHVDGEMDMLAWDLGDPLGKMETVTVNTYGGATYTTNRHPMKGPMMTQTLRGLKGLEPLHWRGDRSSFLAFNGAFNTLLGGTNLSTPDMLAYRDFVNSIVFQPNPNQKLDRTLPAEFGGAKPLTGKDLYQNYVFDDRFGVRCITCHKQTAGQDLPAGNGSVRQIMADLRLDDSQHVKVPHLRNLYQKIGFTNTPGAISISGYGYSHDGRDSTLFEHFIAPRFRGLTNDNAGVNTIKSNLVALLLCFDTGTAPAVGYARTITAMNASSIVVSNDWSLLERQASTRFRDSFILEGSVTNISLVVKGTIDGQRRSLLFRAATTNYLTDKTGVGPFTREELTAKILAGDTLTVMGVPLASGERMGLDRTLSGAFDGDKAAPVLSAIPSESGIAVTWPLNSSSGVLEASDDLVESEWTTAKTIPLVVEDHFSATFPIDKQNRFYRLRVLP